MFKGTEMQMCVSRLLMAAVFGLRSRYWLMCLIFINVWCASCVSYICINSFDMNSSLRLVNLQRKAVSEWTHQDESNDTTFKFSSQVHQSAVYRYIASAAGISRAASRNLKYTPRHSMNFFATLVHFRVKTNVPPSPTLCDIVINTPLSLYMQASLHCDAVTT